MERSYTHVIKAALQQPWSIRPDILPVIAEILVTHVSGRGFTAEEIEQRIVAAPPARPPRSAGAIVILPLHGVLIPKASMMSEMSGGTSLARWRATFREAVGAPQVSAIVIDVDSPGGMVAMTPETAADVRAARGTKPIIAIANTDAASGAYWIASQADEFVVTPSGRVGSIGVVAMHDDVSRALDALGITKTLLSAGRFKTEANPFEPLTDEARAALQDTIDEYYAMFTADVAKGRGTTAAKVGAGYGEGRMLTATRALAAGLVDRVDTFEGVLGRLGVRQVGIAAQETADSGGITDGLVAPHDAGALDEQEDESAQAPVSPVAAASRRRFLRLHRDTERILNAPHKIGR